MTLSTQNECLDGGGNPPKRRRGGQPGNRNARKPINTLCTRIRDLKKRADATIKMVERQQYGLVRVLAACDSGPAHRGHES